MQDIDAAQVRRLQAATTALAARGLPVAAPVATPEGGTVVEHGGSCWTLTPWIPGAHHHGLQLRLAQCGELSRLLAVLHAGLGEVMPPPSASVLVRVPAVEATRTAVDRYLEIAGGRMPLGGFDRLVVERLVQRRRMLAELAHLRPQDGLPAGRVGWVHDDFHTFH